MTTDTNAPYIKNREALAKLLAWLEADAPTVDFDMDVGILRYGNEKSEGQCGTACCIAGAAVQMKLDIFGKPLKVSDLKDIPKLHDSVHGLFNDIEQMELWGNIPETAVEYLGIDMNTLPEQACDLGHVLDLFSNSEDFGDGCTAKQAAQALRNFDETGDPRWEEVMEEGG